MAPDVPVILWHRSFHEVILNDAAIALLGLDAQMMEELAQAAAAGNISPESAKQQAYEDIIWALVNTKEFLFNH